MREYFLAWTEALEQFVLDVIYGQRKGKRAALLRVGLYSLSKVFTVAVKTRRFLYNFRILRDSALGVQVLDLEGLARHRGSILGRSSPPGIARGKRADTSTSPLRQ